MPLAAAHGPLSLKGGTCNLPEELPVRALRVLGRPADAPHGLPAMLHPADVAGLLLEAGLPHECGQCMLQLAASSDCVLSVRASAEVPEGSILVDRVQQHNLHVLPGGDPNKFRLFVPPTEGFELVDMEAEVRLMNGASSSGQTPPAGSKAIEVDAVALTKAFCRQTFHQVLAVNQVVVLHFEGLEIVVRISVTNVLGGVEREDSIGYHCFRGVLSPNTAVYLKQDSATAGLQAAELSQQLSHACSMSKQELPYQSGSTSLSHGTSPPAAAHQSAAASMQQHSRGAQANSSSTTGAVPQEYCCLVNAISRAVRPPAPDTVNVLTNDDECFPVRKRMLRSCIALTKAVRDDGLQCPSCHVDVDTLTFDRVLLFVEAHVMGMPPPQWSLHHVDDLAKAAEVLGLRPLKEYCEVRLGRLSTDNLRILRFKDVVDANASGLVWLILDGMILDVTSWLPEHPGGSTIIPRQSLNMDCARFFELYHASRESFLYLKDFYIGELHPDDRGVVPFPKDLPSADFLDQLRDFTSFRLPCGRSGQAVVKNL